MEKQNNMSCEGHEISPHLKERVCNFFRKGDHKLRKTFIADLTEDNPLTDEICIDSQMAAEFFLKTFLLANKRKYRKYSHDLTPILDACMEIDPSFDILKKVCDSLQGYRGGN